ncbi:MAG: hypothetical protein NTW03_13655, partial [Verrucomicrobia bacterium]|nr:hypothetical protein [Verrucomicrobiota bacterium]
MHVKFLLGPAGSGKTWRCLREISDALKASAGGLPLLLLAPKQATFQLERQLLSQPDLAGYTRLQIVSFERLAQFILSAYGQPLRLLDEDGRVMVLRALLARMERKRELRIFHSTARLPGFARQLSLLLRELQEHGVGPTRLLALSQKTRRMHPLAAKLEDLSSLMRAYTEWLQTHALEDANRLLDLAAEVLRAARTDADGRPEQGGPRLAGLWVDGFAQMTPQEIDLLTALLPFCDRATLAFCLDHEPVEEMSWLSTWS